jgi:translocation and assembly module TamA
MLMSQRLSVRLLLQLALVIVLCLTYAGTARATVSIDGVDPKTSDNILAYLRLDDEPCDAPEWRLRRVFKESAGEIRESLEVVGYYNVAIEQQLERGDSCWHASFVIDPGQPVVLRNVSLLVESDEPLGKVLEKAVSECPLRRGEILQHADYEACKRRISRAAERRGFFSAEFTEHQIDVYPEEEIADVTLLFVTGPRYVYGAIDINQDVLDPNLIRRFNRITPGEPYDAEFIRRLQRDLVSSTYFDQVLFNRTPRGAPYFDVPIEIVLTPGKKYQFSTGIGYATDVGLKLRFDVLNRRVNTRGHQYEFNASLSQVISEFGFTYRIPLDRPRDWYTFDTDYTLQDNDSFKSKLFTTGVQRVQRRDNDWIRSLFLNLRFEDYETGITDDGTSTLLTPGIGYAFVSEDYPPRPLFGHRTDVQLLGAYEGLISDTSFVQIYGTTKWVFSLWDGARLITRAQAGFTLIDELDTLPASVRFYAGGDVSVRGYAYNSLGPTDAAGAVIGGSNLLVGSVEVDHRVYENWSVAAFVDSGNAYDDLNDFEPQTGVGGGVRWYSPLGPIRIDIAFPLASDAPDTYRFHVTLGPDL